MASKRDPQFPDMTDITTLQYLRLLEQGGRVTRKALAECRLHNPVPAQDKPKAIPPAKRKWQKSAPDPKKQKKLSDDLVAPTSPSPDSDLDLNLLLACLWGVRLPGLTLWLQRESQYFAVTITEVRPSLYIEFSPALYRVRELEGTETWVDIRAEPALLGSEIVQRKDDDRIYQLVAPIGGPANPDELLLICVNDGSLVKSPCHALRSPPDSPEFQALRAPLHTWLSENTKIPITLDNIHTFELRFVCIKTKKETKTALLLRHNEATGKIFLYVGTKLRWERLEHCEVTGSYSEPPVPVQLLSSFSYEADLQRAYRAFYRKESVDVERRERDEAAFRGEVRCVVCKYILSDLEYRECGKCRECAHVQCLDEVAALVPLRGTWRCSNCPRCENCFGESGKFNRCRNCNSAYHDKCIDLLLAPNLAKLWKCENCAVCQYCKVRASQHYVKWNDTITMCHTCETKWKKKEYCPICERFWYFEGDRTSEHIDPQLIQESQNMIACDRCQLWIHMKCDTSLTPEDWLHYSVANNTRKYFCPTCTLQKRNEEMVKVVKELMALDLQEFFHHYVDDIHYNKVIKQQMCFDQMLESAKNGTYVNNLSLLKDHFKLICDNAMFYYKTNANGYVTAQKLLKDGMELLQKRLALPVSKRKTVETRPSKPKKPRVVFEKQLPGFVLPLPTSLTRPPAYDFETDRTQHLAIINFQPSHDYFKIIIQRKDIQPYLRTRDKPALYPMAMSVTYTEMGLNYVELCYLCSSFVGGEEAWICRVCGRAFHEFCVDQEKEQSRETWKCRECRVCEICKGTSDFSALIYCLDCGKAFDTTCLWPHLKEIPPIIGWKCDDCFMCDRCGTKSFRDPAAPAEIVTLRKDQDFSKCYQCGWVLDNKQYCPTCDQDWASPYLPVELLKDRYVCRHCGFAFHRGCVETPWRGGCASCLGKNMDYAEAEQTTLAQVQTLMELVSQINFYKSLCKDEIERHYGLPSDFAKMLANFFLVENADFMSNHKDIKRLFQYRGVDIVKKQSSKEANYKTTTLPLFHGLRRSDVPQTVVPEIKAHSPGELLQVWNVDWDTSAVVGKLQKVFSPVETFSVVQEKPLFVPSDPAIFSYYRSIIWDFGQFLPIDLPSDFDQVLHGTNYWWARETEVRDLPMTRSTHSEDLILPISSKMTDTHVEVLTTEVDPTSLATQYVNNEVPTAIALTHRFEEWLRGSLLKLTLHVLNRNRQEKPNGALIYMPKLPETSPISMLCTPLSDPPTSMLPLYSDDPVPGDGTSSLICAFCKREGERQVSGRLLPSEEGLWVHVNCAYWSVDIEWLQECGGLLNFPQALTRSKKSKCSECGKLGATLICSSKKCHNHYHFPCALTAGVRFFDHKTVICRECPLMKDIQTRIALDCATLAAFTKRKWIFTTGKRYARKPPFTRHEFNRIGSLILCEIPEEGVHEQLESLRLTWIAGRRTLVRCSKKDHFFKVTEEQGPVVCSSEAVEELWPLLKLGDSFHLRCAADFFGYSSISNYLPPYPETATYLRNIKEKKPRTLQEILDSLHSPSPGASLFLPYDKHRMVTVPKVRSSNTKSTHFEDTEVVHKKDDLTLASEYRKYKKTPNRDEHVEVLRSGIHGLGLFTNVEFLPGNLVVEYIGEMVRNKVADRREKEYEAKGIGNGSCYMFRLDEDYIVDATVKGGKARFINHSCQPNCEATICEINGEKHILLFAKRRIFKFEEITYDYHFEVETDKISCTCGSKDCQGKLN